jgi:hypothetical protein
MPWGRERMAEGWYEAAKKELNKPNPDRSLARWNLDAATNLNPKFAEAIQLREQLTGVELSSADGSAIRSFVRRAILNDVVPSTQPTTAPVLRAALPKASEVPTSQPFTSGEAPVTEVPATQPAGEMTAETPTTQPTEEVSVEAPTEEIAVPPVMEETPAAPEATEETPSAPQASDETSSSTPLEEGTAEVLPGSDNASSANVEQSESTGSTSATEEKSTESSSDSVTATPTE